MNNQLVKKIKRIVLLSLVGLAVVGTFVFLWKKAQPEVIEYEIVTPERGTVETKTVATGNVEPRYEILIKPQISGIISEVLKEAGQRVTEGEIIAKVKVIPEMGQLNSAESRVNVARISLDQVESTHRRDEQLFKQGILTAEEFDVSKANYRKAKEELANSQSSLEIVRDGISRNSRSSSTTQIRSTITGMILNVPIKVGNSVIQSNSFNDGTTIATVANMNDLIFRGNIDETEVGSLVAGMPMKITIGALQNEKLQASLEYISPKAVESNGANQCELKAAITGLGTTRIRSGYSANAEIVLAEAKGVMTVPESCIEFVGNDTFVYLVKGDAQQPVYQRRQVSVGLSDGINIEIKKGLTRKDSVRGPKKVADKDGQ